MEGLVLKSIQPTARTWCIEAPRGGAGIEIILRNMYMYLMEAPRGGAGIEIA